MVHSTQQIDAIQPRSNWSLWFRWTAATAAGELVGFAVPAVLLPLALAIGMSESLLPLAAVLAGAGEGASLGFAQWLVLRRCVPNITRRTWVLTTMLGAMFAYAVAMIPTSLVDFDKLDQAILIAGGSAIGLLFLLSMGLPQWLVLRHQLRNSEGWVLANAIAWPLGVAVPFIGLAVIPDNSPMGVVVVTGILCGVLMGVVVGALTGIALVWLLRANLMRVKSVA